MSVNAIGGGSADYAIQQQSQRARGGNASGARSAGAEYNPAAYLQDLNSRLDAKVIPGAWDGKSSFGAKRATAMIHPEFLKKMHDDPALGTLYEQKINDWAKIDADIRKRMKAEGNTITSLGMSVDKDGKETYHMSGVYTGGKSESNKADDKESFMDEMMKRLDEKRQKEKDEAKRAEAKEAAAAMASGVSADASYSIDTTA